LGVQDIIGIGAGLSAAIIAGIIIAAVVCCGASGAGAYAVYSKNPFEKDGSVMNNPLYAGVGNEFNNPLNRAQL